MTDVGAPSDPVRRYLLVLIDRDEGDHPSELADFVEGVRDDQIRRHHHLVEVSACDELVELRPRRDVLIAHHNEFPVARVLDGLGSVADRADDPHGRDAGDDDAPKDKEALHGGDRSPTTFFEEAPEQVTAATKRGQRARLRFQRMPTLAAFPSMMSRDRKHEGLRVCRAAWQVGVSVREYREMEAGDRMPSPGVYGRICELYGWPQSFVGAAGGRHARRAG